MGRLDGYIPTMGMIGLQFHYAALAIFTRAALVDGLSPTVFVVYRQAIATLALAPIFFSSKRRQSFKISLGFRSFSLMFLTSLVGVTANQNAYFKGLYYASSTAATAMSNLIPAVTFVIATIVGYEKIDLRSLRSMAKILGTVCCVSGALTMAFLKGHKLLHMEFLPYKHLSLTTSGGENWLLGCLLLLASSVFWSCWMILQVPISSSCPDHLLSTFWMCLFSTIQSAIFALIIEQDLQAWILHSPLEISCCLYAGIGIAVSFFAQSWCISERGPLYCAMFNPLATVITALISATFLQEELYVGSVIGAVGVIIGLYIVLWGKAKEFDGIKQEAPQSNLQDDEIRSKIDLEEPLLSDKSEHVAESKMEP
ncbi:WAT1-related protein At4g30420-like isoform X2 [Gastrolobium bilobum]|uniref:WAT1-related protein At4g30420-like isoform X2 n=1 Tax=Gastrolobium bilobum TaxID=150636 RepID=UPI002AB27258|nr:WAT1-related protein At4g30420-like isoform X2 [Gastrolobium bilobum]